MALSEATAQELIALLTRRPVNPEKRDREADHEGENEDLENLAASCCVKDTFTCLSYDEIGFLSHINSLRWSSNTKRILQPTFGPDGRVIKLGLQYIHRSPENLFSQSTCDTAEHRPHVAHYQILGMSTNGIPTILGPIQAPLGAFSLWKCLTSIEKCRPYPMTGRVTIVRDPSPPPPSAPHYTMHQIFDMDGIFDLFLNQSSGLNSYPFHYFDWDQRRLSTFVVALNHLTLVGENCRPNPWQLLSKEPLVKGTRIRPSRCTTVTVLKFMGNGSQISTNTNARAKRKSGRLWSPFAPWYVVN